MAQSHVLSGLIKKRQDLQAQADYIRKQVVALDSQVETLGQAIKIIEPDFDQRSIRPKKAQHQSERFYVGQTSRLIANVLREATGPLTPACVADQVASQLNEELTDKQAERLGQRVRKTLYRLSVRGLVIKSSGGFSLDRESN